MEELIWTYGSRAHYSQELGQQAAGGKATKTSEDHILNCEKEADRTNRNGVEFS